MTTNPYKLQLPDPNVMPARNLRGGFDSYIVMAGSSADAAAYVEARSDSSVWGNATLVTPTVLAAATTMNGWTFRIRLYNASSPPVEVADLQVTANGAAIGTVAASGVLTSSANYSDAETVTIGTRVYTFQSSLTAGDGHVHIGASEAASIANLHHAINKSGGTPGTDYNVTAADPLVTAVDNGSHTVTVTARQLGTAGNSITSTETSATASWGSATLTGGVSTTDLVSSLANLMVTALNGAGIGISGAAYNASTDLLTVAAASDNLGNYIFDAAFFPPPRGSSSVPAGDDQEADFYQPGTNFNVGVDVNESFPIPGFVGAITDGGSAGAALTVALVADTYTIPTLILAARAQE